MPGPFDAGAPGGFSQPGSVRQPPPLRSVLKLQKTIGNRAVQELLGINKPVEVVPVPEPGPVVVGPKTIELVAVRPVVYPRVAAAGGAAGVVIGGAAGVGLSGIGGSLWVAGPIGALCGLAVGAAVACCSIWTLRRSQRRPAALPHPQ